MRTDSDVLRKVGETVKGDMPKAGDCSGTGGGRRSGDARDLPLLLFRVGAAITLSIAGLVLSRLRSSQRRPRPRHLLLPPPSEQDDGRGIKGCRGGLKEELRILKNQDTKAKIISGNSVHTTTTTTTTTTTASVSLPPKCRNVDDDEGFLLPEFSEMVMEEFGREVGNIATSPAARVWEDAPNEHEINKLRDMVRSLQEREKTLEIQLLEFYGLQEQDAAVRELENQLKINNVESKLYSLKIESLQSENQRLQTQLSESSKLTSELETTKSKCKLLKKKLRLDAEEAKERITSLQKIVDSFQCKEVIAEGGVDPEVEKKLKRLEELENEARELRAANSRLQQENSHLIRRLELTRLPPVPKSHHSMEVKASEEAVVLKQENEKLSREVEQLQTDRFADVEELVYLKWINACLRHELKNKGSPGAQTSARDLSNTLSPKSEETAKQLIMEYANVGADERSLSSIEFGSEYASSRASSTGEPDDASIDMSSMTKHSNPKKKEKKKFFSKLRKLVLGKDKEKNNFPTLERRVSISSCSFEDFTGRESHDSYSSFMTEGAVSANQQHDDRGSSRHSFGSNKYSHPSIEVGDGRKQHHGVKKNATFGSERFSGSQFDSGEATIPEDAEIHKFAEALITSRTGSISSRRTASFG